MRTLSFQKMQTVLIMAFSFFCLFVHTVSASLELSNSTDDGNVSKVNIKPLYTPPPLAKSNPFDIDVYVDATGSMRGFATINGDSTTTFAKTLEYIYRVRDAFANTSVDFYKFTRIRSKTKKIEKLKNKSFRQAFDWNFYKGNTNIDDVIQEMEGDNLKIIVTDLFQTDADMSSVIDAINEKRFPGKDTKADTSLSLYRVTSEFDGDIGHLGNDVSFHHKGKLSFYILVFGKYADVISFNNVLSDDLKKEHIDFNQINLSPFLLNPILSFDNVRISDLKKKQNITNINLSNIVKEPGLQFRVNTRKEKAVFQVELPLGNSNNSIIWTKNCNYLVYPYLYQYKQLVKADTLKDLISVQTIKDAKDTNKNKILMEFVINSKDFNKQTYKFTVLSKLGEESSRVPDWVYNWDMDISKSTEWAGNPTSYPGTTLNLKFFIERVWKQIKTNYEPTIGVFTLYISSI